VKSAPKEVPVVSVHHQETQAVACMQDKELQTEITGGPPECKQLGVQTDSVPSLMTTPEDSGM